MVFKLIFLISYFLTVTLLISTVHTADETLRTKRSEANSLEEVDSDDGKNCSPSQPCMVDEDFVNYIKNFRWTLIPIPKDGTLINRKLKVLQELNSPFLIKLGRRSDEEFKPRLGRGSVDLGIFKPRLGRNYWDLDKAK